MAEYYNDPMKYMFIVILALGSCVELVTAQEKPDLTDPNQQYNYALGMDIISTFKQFKVDIDLKAFTAGMEDALDGKPALTPEQQKAAMDSLSKQMAAQAAVELKAIAAQNLKAGEAFLAENATKEGVHVKEVTAPDGSKTELQYRILQSGPPGPSPQKTDTVEVHYVGSLIDGTVFDSSVKRGTPATFSMAHIMPGWGEALQMMKAGDKWELFLPPKLGFGEVGPPQTGPDSTLIFELELRGFFTPKNVITSPATNAQAAAVKPM
jgi:FKBP-type peptidyl-prolyl cis-trans isomerase